MRAFPDPSASVDRAGDGDGVGDDFEIVPATQKDADMGVEQESIHSPFASSSSETPEENKRNEEPRRQKAADRATQKKRSENAPPHQSTLSKPQDSKSQCTMTSQSFKDRETKITTKLRIWCMALTGMTPSTRFSYLRLAEPRKI